MTASSSCSGSADNFWSRDDIRVHTFGVHPKAVEVLAEGSVRRQADPHRNTDRPAFVGRLQPAHHRTLAEQRFELEPLRRELPVLIPVGISLALGLAIDGSDHKVRLASTRFHSPLANPCRRPSSMGAPPMSEARELARIVV